MKVSVFGPKFPDFLRELRTFKKSNSGQWRIQNFRGVPGLLGGRGRQTLAKCRDSARVDVQSSEHIGGHLSGNARDARPPLSPNSFIFRGFKPTAFLSVTACLREAAHVTLFSSFRQKHGG